MAELRTKATDGDVEVFLQSIDEPLQSDCRELVRMMRHAVRAEPVMWGSGIVGFGAQHVRYVSGRELDWFRIGFAPRKKNLTLYLSGGLAPHAEELARLGPHTTGKGCLYLKRLDAVDRGVLAEILDSAARIDALARDA